MKWSMSCARYYSLIEKCRESLEYSSKKYRNFKYDTEKETYIAAEERYNFACKDYIKRIEASGLKVPDELKKSDDCYLQWEGCACIGKTFKALKAIHSNRKRIKSGEKLLLDNGDIIDSPDFISNNRKKINKKIKKIIIFLYSKGITWKYSETGKNWIILIEPRSKKRVKVEIDITGHKSNKIYIKDLADTLRLLSKTWDKSMDSTNAGKNTLVDCGWHAYYSDEIRRIALDKAILIYGRVHIVKALYLCKRSPWLENYQKTLDFDIKYASKGISSIKSCRKYDRLIYIALV